MQSIWLCKWLFSFLFLLIIFIRLSVLWFILKQEPSETPEELLNGLRYVRPGSGFIPNFQLFEMTEVNGEKAFKLNPNGTYLSQIGTGRVQGYINNLTNTITTSQAYSEIGSSGLTLNVDNTGNIQYTSNNIYTFPDWEFAGFGYLSLFLDEL